MTSETYLDLTFDRFTNGGSGGVSNSVATDAAADGGGVSVNVVGSSGKRPIRPKLLKLNDVTIPHRNRKKTKTKSKDRSLSSVRDRIYDDPAYTDDISHLAIPVRNTRRSSCNADSLLTMGSGVGTGTSGGSSSLGKRSKLTKEFQKLAQEDMGHIAFSSSEEDLRYQRGRSLERSNAITAVDQKEKIENKKRVEKRSTKQKRNLSLDNKRQQSQQELEQNEERQRDRPPEPPQRLALTRHNLGKQRSDEAAWQRQQSQTDFPPTHPDNEDVFSLHSSAKENQSVAASTAASASNASTSRIQMGKRFLRGEIGIKSFNYYLLKEGLKSSKKFVEKQKTNFQSSTTAAVHQLLLGDNPNLSTVKEQLRANSEENIYEEIFFKDQPPSEDEDENRNSSNVTNTNVSSSLNKTKSEDPNVLYADCELCMQQCDKPDCQYCIQPDAKRKSGQPSFNVQNNKTANVGNRLNTGNLNNNTSAVRAAMENQVNAAPILEFQSYNPNNPGVYKIETTPVAITGDYNPILQFQQSNMLTQQKQQQHQQTQQQQQQQSTSTTSTATTTPSDQHLHQQQHNHQQQFYPYKQPNFYTPLNQPAFWSHNTTATPRPRGFIVGNNHLPSGVSSMQRMNTKSSSSSDSLQHPHKFNTFTHLDANFYNTSNMRGLAGSSQNSGGYLPPQPLQPLMYAASRRLGGSQILVENSHNMFDNPPQIYKSDSRASILSEYSLSRSSDTYYGGQRFGANRHYAASQLNDPHNFENSLMSSYATAAQRRYFGSAESCRFAYDCRRCSLDSGPGAGLLSNPRMASNSNAFNNVGVGGANEKCTFSDHCRSYDCRNCDCSSVYFSSDFDDIYSGGGIPRKTAKGTLPSTGGQPPPAEMENFELACSQEKQQALKQNKYAQDFFKHVNDVKRSIYQAEMQRNGNIESMSPKKSAKKEHKDRERENERDRDILGITTLPLAKERLSKPTPAPRTSLKQAPPNLQQSAPQPLRRRLDSKNLPQTKDRKEYASLDRLISSNTGAIPKMGNCSTASPHHSPKARPSSANIREINDMLNKKDQCNLSLEPAAVANSDRQNEERRHVKKQSKDSSKTSSFLIASHATHRRKDVPAPPPPSPATYADIQELRQNMQDTMRDDTKPERKRKRKQHDLTEQTTTTTTSPQPVPFSAEEEQSTEVGSIITKDFKTINHKEMCNEINISTIQITKGPYQTHETTNNTIEPVVIAANMKPLTTTETHGNEQKPQSLALPNANAKEHEDEHHFDKKSLKNQITNLSLCSESLTDENCSTVIATASTSTLVSITSVSSSIVTALDYEQQKQQQQEQRDHTEVDDDVFYDARSEDSACATAASNSMPSYTLQKQQINNSSTDMREQHFKDSEQPEDKYLKNFNLHPPHQTEEANQQQLEDDSGHQQIQQHLNLEGEGQTDNEQQQLNKTDEDKHASEALQEQQMNINEVESLATSSQHKTNNNENNTTTTTNINDNDLRTPHDKVHIEVKNATTNNKEENITTTDITCPTTTTTAITTANGTNTILEGFSELNANKHLKQKPEINECAKNELPKYNDKDNEKQSMKMEKRETKRFKHKRDEEERKENRTKTLQNTDDDKPSTTLITNKIASSSFGTATTKKHHRTQRRSLSFQHQQPQHKTPTTSNLSCDTCCQLEWSQDLHNDRDYLHQQQSSPQTLKPPTLHIGMAGQPTRVTKRKSGSYNTTSKERASKTKQEIKTKIIYKQETPESTTTTTTTTMRETGISITVTKTNKTTVPNKDLTTTSATKTKSTNVSETKEQRHKEEEDNKNKTDDLNPQVKINDTIKTADIAETGETKPKVVQNSNILQEIKDITEDIALLLHEAETSDSPTLPGDAKQHVDATTFVDGIKANVDKTVEEAMDQQQTNEAVDGAAATGNDSKTNTTNISCNSELAGVTTHSQQNSSSHIVPLITTLQCSITHESELRRPPLQRQDYSCFDSSEAQSDDSHLTKDSVTIESQNDEFSSSTLDKIDVSTLPLPALPPKKRRTKLRASPSKYHHCRSRHDSPQQQELRDPHEPNDSQPITSEDFKHLSAFQQYVAKRRQSLEASTRCFNEKLEARRMHYHMGGGGGGVGGTGGPNGAPTNSAGIHMPTYLFGEQYYTGSSRKSTAPASKEEIFLNKSGWVQVNTKRTNDENRGNRSRSNYNHQQNGDLHNTIRVIQIDKTRRSDMARQALLQHQHSMMESPKFVSSKVEELIQRNEARLGNSNKRDCTLRPGYRIVDPQLASILNERPGFLPVKNLNDRDSPPPITPILSPPPAFQDSSTKVKSFDRRRTISTRPIPHQQPQPQAIINNSSLQAVNGGIGNKGMVFSRSFEYDNRRPTTTDVYVETFSRSFDGNLTDRVVVPVQRDRSPNFSTLTGNSPNYLSKKDSGGGSSGSLKSRDSSPKYQSPTAGAAAQSPQTQKTTAYLNTSVKEAPPSYNIAGNSASLAPQKYSPRSTHHDRSFERAKSHNVLGRSRKSQFSRSGSGSTAVMANVMGVSRFRSFDITANQRLNSCDSGARSDLSNDELDIEEDDAGSSEFLNTNSYHPATSPFNTQRQRSLTPDRNESHSSSSSLRKQRSITPDSRSLTPEDRRKKGSQVSLMGSRQNSSSRSNTLERKHEKLNISRSSSSSSYSGREHDNHGHTGGHSGVLLTSGGGNGGSNQHRRSLGRNAKQADEHRIRRSRSLQLTERSPNRGHKMVVCVGQTHANSNQPPIYQQTNMRPNISNMPANNFPPTIRTTGKSQSILLNTTNGSATRHRQNDIDKSRSFDFDYCNYNNVQPALKQQKAPHSNNSIIGAHAIINREAAMRLDFDKSRSFDEDYREAVPTNNNLNTNAVRYLQAVESSDRNHAHRMRRSSPVDGNGRNTRSPQSSGSSCNNLSVPRSTTSPQNYGTRLCDHEMTYDLMRKSLDRSPIMDFRRGDSAGGVGDYDMPVALLRNRETINSGGNSELNFMNSEASRGCDHMSAPSSKQQRSLRRTLSPNEYHYSMERTHGSGSRDDLTPPEPTDYRHDYNDMYRRTRSNNRGSDLFKYKTTNLSNITKTPPNKKLLENQRHQCSTAQCSYWPQCCVCQKLQHANYDYIKSLPIKRQNSLQITKTQNETINPTFSLKHTTSINSKDYNNKNSFTNVNSNISTVQVNVNVIHLEDDDETSSTLSLSAQTAKENHLKSTVVTQNSIVSNSTTRPASNSASQWKLLCKNAVASAASVSTSSSALEVNDITNTVVNVKSSPALMSTNETSTLQTRVIPLAPTSLVFLGAFEGPINRDNHHDDHNDIYAKTIDEKNLQKYQATINDNLKILCANDNATQEKQTTATIIPTPTVQTSWFKDNNMIMFMKIPENSFDSTGSSKDHWPASSSNNNRSCLNNNSSSTNSFTIRSNSSSSCKSIEQRLTTKYLKRSNKQRQQQQQQHRYQRSLSLPNIWLNVVRQGELKAVLQKGYTRTTTPNDGISVIGIRNGFPANLSNQIRAVSSPSLTLDKNDTATKNAIVDDCHHQRVPSSNSSYNASSQDDCQTISSSATTNNTPIQNVGVLQKFKRTLTNFNKSQQPAPHQTTTSALLVTDTEMQTQQDVPDGCSNKYRFGPLVWRTSKERRKTKYNRRDKCNSGDSGIQIELENDEQFARALASNGGVIHSSGASNGLFRRKDEKMNSLRVRAVRRTNSAKVTSILDEKSVATKSKIFKRMDMHHEREAPESLPTRSLSQPNGLESCGMTRNDLDGSDSDSVTSHDEANYFTIYAEVLYNFTAAGPQELGLEKGTLIEILRKEIGPWWFGRIKKEDASLVEEILDPELGWFPKEFVRIIHTPETDYFFQTQLAEQQKQQQQKNDELCQTVNENITTTTSKVGNQTLNTSISVPCTLSNSSMEDNCHNTTVIDQHNVTTIIIESSSSSATSPLFRAETENMKDGAKDITATLLPTTTLTCSSQATLLSTSQSLNVIMDSTHILRRSAVKELLDTEINYVKLLAAICEGYLPAMSKRIDIFSSNSIRLIFSNITAIYKFQRKFLEALRKGIEQNQVAKVFLKMHKGFLCYSTYCNSYPRALIELASYERVKDARTILDNCRESENLAELPLSAHLLAPVQRICRYPLHLAEIIKTSVKGVEPPAFALPEYEQIDVSQLDIPDTTEVLDMALEAMKSVTEAVNEGKRHSETIARHQASFQNFKGPPLHLHSTRFFVQIDATRQKQNLWNSSCTLFLFDNQLVYCKRDIIKRSNFIYKGRIFLDRCRVVNVRDGKMFGHTIKNSLRIYCEARDKWFDFSFRSASRKQRFLSTLALERQFSGKALYISEMTGFEYAYDERDCSDQSDYEAADNGEQKLKDFLYETNLTSNNTNTSGESSVPESPAKSFKYSSDTLPLKKIPRVENSTLPPVTDNQTGSLGRRRLGNWFRKPKSSASTPNHSPTHKPTQSAHSTGDLQLAGTDLTETYTVFENSENGGVSS